MNHTNFLLKDDIDYEKRIEILEAQVAKLQSDLHEVILHFLNVDGQSDAYHQAILALLMSTPPDPLLDKVLPDLLMRKESTAVHESKAEAVLDGVQTAQALILAIRKEAHKLHEAINNRRN